MKSHNLHCALTAAAACIGIVLCAALLSNAAEFKMQEFKIQDFKMTDFKLPDFNSSASIGESAKQQQSPAQSNSRTIQITQKKPQSSVPNSALPVLPLPGTKK